MVQMARMGLHAEEGDDDDQAVCEAAEHSHDEFKLNGQRERMSHLESKKNNRNTECEEEDFDLESPVTHTTLIVHVVFPFCEGHTLMFLACDD